MRTTHAVYVCSSGPRSISNVKRMPTFGAIQIYIVARSGRRWRRVFLVFRLKRHSGEILQAGASDTFGSLYHRIAHRQLTDEVLKILVVRASKDGPGSRLTVRLYVGGFTSIKPIAGALVTKLHRKVRASARPFRKHDVVNHKTLLTWMNDFAPAGTYRQQSATVGLSKVDMLSRTPRVLVRGMSNCVRFT